MCQPTPIQTTTTTIHLESTRRSNDNVLIITNSLAAYNKNCDTENQANESSNSCESRNIDKADVTNQDMKMI